MTHRRPTYLSAAAPERASEFLTFKVETLSTGADGAREVTGLALPYGEDLDRPDWFTGATRQRFAEGSAVVRDNATFYYGHDHLNGGLPVGRIIAHEQTPAGLRLTTRLSATPKGDEVYTLLKDGVLDSFSVGFYRVHNELVDAETDNPVLLHTEIDVFEVSAVPDPAFKTARIDSVLSATPGPTTKGTNMTPEQRARLAALRAQETLSATEAAEMVTLSRLEAGGAAAPATAQEVQVLSESIDTLERRIATLGSVDAGDQLRAAPASSYGEFLQMVARGDQAATDFLAYVGGVVGDLGDHVRDAWVGDRYRLITERRTVLNLFASSPLPASGMNVEFGKVSAASDTTSVTEQAAEGDTLAYGKVTFSTDTAPVKTYGGWGEMSRQEVERSSMAVVERFFDALNNRYAQTTEAAARAAVSSTANAYELTTATPDLDTADGWIDFVTDAAFWLDDKGLPLEFLIVGRDVFKSLAKLRDGNNADAPRLLDRRSGTINIVGLNGTMFNLPVVPVNTAGLVRAGHSSALRSFEAGGVPFRLQDDDITNLTKAMSIYGYMALALEDTDALVRPNDGV